MKIGIVTQPLLGNYGGIIQNFALQTVLRKMGHDPVTLDYVPSLGLYRFMCDNVKAILLYFSRRRRKFVKYYSRRENKGFADFVSRYIATTHFIHRYNNGVVQRYGLEAMVTGSDQVWRPKYNDNLKDLYLDFVLDKNVRRIAYAASFGTADMEYSKKDIESCRNAAIRLQSISLREASGVTLFERYFGRKATEVLDPTLLLTAEEYSNIVSDVSITSQSFLVAYILDDRNFYADLLNHSIIAQGIERVVRIVENDPNISPKDWIAAFRDASFVVTDSFHGTVFSIIFRKPFIVFCNKSRGSDRVYSLLSKLGLSSRIVYPDGDCIGALRQPIAWESVADKLELLKKESLDFLCSSLI